MTYMCNVHSLLKSLVYGRYTIFSSGNVADLISSTDGKDDLVSIFIAEEGRQVHKHSLLERNDTADVYIIHC